VPVVHLGTLPLALTEATRTVLATSRWRPARVAAAPMHLVR
jgi:hypothetical protein